MKTNLKFTTVAFTFICGVSLADDPPTAQMKAVLAELKALGGKPIETLTAAEARKQPTPADAVVALLKKEGKSTAPEEVASVKDGSYPGGDGKDQALRIYTPKGNGPFPVIVYYHGGGWVIADLDVYDSSPRALANAAEAIVVSVEYRKAPENKFPAAHQDAFAAYQWVLKNAGSFNGDVKKIAVAGESAGGNLAASVCIMAKEKDVALPVHQLLVYPVTDATDMTTESYKEYADAKPLNLPMMKWFASQTLADPADAKSPLLSIALAGKKLKGLPPATIINAEIDPLSDDGEKLEDAFEAEGVKVTRKEYDGVVHEFFGMGAFIPEAKDAVKFAAKQLKAAF